MKTKVKAARKPKLLYRTIGVRYLVNPNKRYTFRVKAKAKLHIGQLLIDLKGDAICAVVEIHEKPQDTDFGITYRYIEHKVVEL